MTGTLAFAMAVLTYWVESPELVRRNDQFKFPLGKGVNSSAFQGTNSPCLVSLVLIINSPRVEFPPSFPPVHRAQSGITGTGSI